MSAIEFPLTQSFSGACPRCRFVIPPLSETSAVYFEQGYVACSSCANRVDLWEATLEKVTRMTGFAFSLAALGPRVTYLRVRLLPHQTVELELTRHGVSESATILAIAYTPQGGNCLPLETHSNMPRRRFLGTRVYLYGVQMRTSDGVLIEEEFSGENISVMVLWAPVQQSEISWLYLVDAIEAVTTGRLSQAIVPAHAAVEIAIAPVVRQILLRHSTKENTDRLLRQEMGFASMLGVVLPVLCALLSAKPMPDKIRAELDTLRELRNRTVHRGVLPDQVSEEQVRRLLCAAAFGVEYGKYLRQFLAKSGDLS
jgi:hypothetical protein